MHDLGLGPPVEGERLPDATHAGPCFDGVYGCHRCWDDANEGKGTLAICEWCKAENVPTRITRAIDEPVLYALCAPCVAKQNAELRRMELEYPTDDFGDDYECDEDP
jgi:hypothetical protein